METRVQVEGQLTVGKGAGEVGDWVTGGGLTQGTESDGDQVECQPKRGGIVSFFRVKGKM